MTPQMENVIPAGANRFGYESETSPVPIPPMGSIFANAFTAIIAIYVSATIKAKLFERVLIEASLLSVSL
jgi:hypothetical protein